MIFLQNEVIKANLNIVDTSTILEISMSTLRFTLRQPYDLQVCTNKLELTC